MGGVLNIFQSTRREDHASQDDGRRKKDRARFLSSTSKYPEKERLKQSAFILSSMRCVAWPDCTGVHILNNYRTPKTPTCQLKNCNNI